MREIKVRGWDGLKMYYFDLVIYMTFNEEAQEDLCPFLAIQNLMLHTGLSDKNGKEIYEGDLVQIDNTDEVSRWVRGEKALVEHKPGRFRIVTNSGQSNMMQEDMSDVIEVIGNIHENPELTGEVS